MKQRFVIELELEDGYLPELAGDDLLSVAAEAAEHLCREAGYDRATVTRRVSYGRTKSRDIVVTERPTNAP